MKLLSKSKARLHRQQKAPSRKEHNASIQSAAPHPCQLKCKVKGPDGNQVALVPICLPLSIMASYAVKAAGGSDEVACIASVAVIAQGNSIVSQMKTEALLTEREVNEYIDTVAIKTRETVMCTVGEKRIADEVEAMIRGGGQLIINSNKEEEPYEESRDDNSEGNDAMIAEDVQSIATSVLNNFDRDLGVSTSYGMKSENTTEEDVAMKPSRFHSTMTAQTYSTSTTDNQTTIDVKGEPSVFRFWVWGTPNNKITAAQSTASSELASLDKILQAHSELQPSKQPTSFDRTLDTSNNANEYGTTSTFNLDTFSPVPPTFYNTIPHDILGGCPNLSMEPVSDNEAPTTLKTKQNDAYHGLVAKVDSSDYTNTGRGIFAISSNIDVSNAPNFPVNITNTSGRDNKPENLNFDQSVTTRSIQSQLIRHGCCSLNAPCSCPEATRQKHNFNDQASTSPQTYQSYVEPGKEVDDITFLNTQRKMSLVKRLSRIFRMMNCKSS
jgi:hypothetical protein